jgi:hypothetical protein
MTHYLVIAGPYLGAKVAPVSPRPWQAIICCREVDGSNTGGWLVLLSKHLQPIRPLQKSPVGLEINRLSVGF